MKNLLNIFVFCLLLFPQTGMSQWSWKTHQSFDVMTGSKTVFAVSPLGSVLKQTDPRYKTMNVFISVGKPCYSKFLVANISFSNPVPLFDSEYMDRKRVVRARTRWGNMNVSTNFFQRHKRSGVFNPLQLDSFIWNIKEFQEVLVGMETYRGEQIYFRISLRGSTQAIQDAINLCN